MDSTEKMEQHEDVEQNRRTSHFDYFWDIAIKPSIDQAWEKIDGEYRDACAAKMKNLQDYRRHLERIYTEKREWLKKIYLPHEEDPLLDFHKLAAVICRSVLQEKPIRFNVQNAISYAKTKWPQRTEKQPNVDEERMTWFIDNLYVNYKIAFLAGLGIGYIDLYAQLKETGQIALKEQLAQEGQFVSYPKSANHESFFNSMVLALAKNEINNRSFDYLGFATNIFQLQQYTLMVFKDRLSKLTQTKY